MSKPFYFIMVSAYFSGTREECSLYFFLVKKRLFNLNDDKNLTKASDLTFIGL